MQGKRRDTRSQILAAARKIVRQGGPGALTFDAVARRLGISKQAVIYWFPAKEALVTEVVLPALKGEVEAGTAAVLDGAGGSQAVARFVRAVAAYHLADLDRFRMMYLVPQLPQKPAVARFPKGLVQRIHPVTSGMYDALEAALGAGPGATRAGCRRRAVNIHFSTLGVVLMVALADAVGDPLAHSTDSLVESLVALMTGADAAV